LFGPSFSGQWEIPETVITSSIRWNQKRNHLTWILTYFWSKYGQITVKMGHFSKLTTTLVFSELEGSIKAPWNRRHELNSKKQKKVDLTIFWQKWSFLTLIWPYFDPKLAITIVWTELFGPLKAPRNRPHELYSTKQNKNDFFHFFQILWSNNPFFDQILTIIWP